jgi:MFS family permease
MSTQRFLRALAHRNFRLFLIGQGISLIGTFMQQVAVSWVVLTRTNSASLLGVVAFAGQIPGLAVAPVAGVLVDHWNRHRLLLVTQTVAMFQALALAALVFTGVLAVWHLVALSLLLGVVNAFDMTARQAFLPELLDRREDLANAIALNSSLVNVSRLVGPLLAGLVLWLTSAGICFLANGLSYLAVLAALLAMRVPPRQHAARRVGLWEGLREGARYVFGFAPIRSILLLLAMTSLLGMSYLVLLPVFARDVLGGGAGTLGVLTGASGLGALTAAVLLAGRQSVLGLGRWITLAPALFGVGLIGFSLVREVWLAAPLLAVVGFAMIMQMSASNTVLQTIVPEDRRGRVMSYYTMAFLGMAPLGSLLGGTLADAFGDPGVGAPVVVRGAGACAIVGSLLFALQLRRLRQLVRPIYARMGILPEAASGVQAATPLNVPPETPS